MSSIERDAAWLAREGLDGVVALRERATRAEAEVERLRKAIEMHKWARRGEGDLVDVELWEALDPSGSEKGDRSRMEVAFYKVSGPWGDYHRRFLTLQAAQEFAEGLLAITGYNQVGKIVWEEEE